MTASSFVERLFCRSLRKSGSLGERRLGACAPAAREAQRRGRPRRRIAGPPGSHAPGALRAARAREPRFDLAAAPVERRPLARVGLAIRAGAGTALGIAGGALLSASLAALKAMRATPPRPFDIGPPLAAILHPTTPAGCLLPVGMLVFGEVCGLVTAAIVAARHGLGQEVSEPLAGQPTPSTR